LAIKVLDSKYLFDYALTLAHDISRGKQRETIALGIPRCIDVNSSDKSSDTKIIWRLSLRQVLRHKDYLETFSIQTHVRSYVGTNISKF